MRSLVTPSFRSTGSTGGARVERRRQLANRRHQIVGRERRGPLLHAEQVPRVERQHGSAARLPHAVAVAEARERRAMPVLDRRRPTCSRASGRRSPSARRRSSRSRCVAGGCALKPASSSVSAARAVAASRRRWRRRPAGLARSLPAPVVMSVTRSALREVATLAPCRAGRSGSGRPDRTADVQSNPSTKNAGSAFDRVLLDACRASPLRPATSARRRARA